MLYLFFVAISSKVSFGINDERQFVNWMRTNNQFFTGSEYHLRLGIFLTNIRYIQNFNRRKGLSFTLGINKFSCYTPLEYRSLLGVGGSRSREIKKSKSVRKLESIPDSYDWRDHGVVNPIKNQLDCGGCWAFATTATSEAAYAIKSGTLLTFSEQNLLDCADFCSGCNGGWPDFAILNVIYDQNGQFMLESDYPYQAAVGKCAYDPSKAVGEITASTYIEDGDENDLKEKVASTGVVAVCINAANIKFMSYTSGIYDNEECKVNEPDHAVAVIGYGSENGIDFWIVRNSWGDSWGENGYIRMIRNKNNQCGIASDAVVAFD